MPFGLPSEKEEHNELSFYKKELDRILVENELLKRKLRKKELEEEYNDYLYAKQDVLENCSAMYSNIIIKLIDEKITLLDKEISLING